MAAYHDPRPWEAALGTLGISPDPTNTESLAGFVSDVDSRMYWLLAVDHSLFLLDDALQPQRHFTRFQRSTPLPPLAPSSTLSPHLRCVAVKSEGKQVQVAVSLGCEVQVFSLLHPALPLPSRLALALKSGENGRTVGGSSGGNTSDAYGDGMGEEGEKDASSLRVSAAALAAAKVEDMLEGKSSLPVPPSSGGDLPSSHPWLLWDKRTFSLYGRAPSSKPDNAPLSPSPSSSVLNREVKTLRWFPRPLSPASTPYGSASSFSSPAYLSSRNSISACQDGLFLNLLLSLRLYLQ